MRFVALETSTDRCSVALWRDGDLCVLERRAENRHGEFVLPMLERLLGEAGLKAADLEAVAFGSGPGSFTGLRIACGVAQGLAFARDLPVIGITSFQAIAEESGAQRVIACLDARMGEVYYAAMQTDPSSKGGWIESSAPACVAPGAVAVPPGEGWLGCGGGFGAHGETLQARLGRALGGMHPEIRPGAAAIARLAAPRLAAGEGYAAALAVPFYLRERVALTTAERASGRRLS